MHYCTACSEAASTSYRWHRTHWPAWCVRLCILPVTGLRRQHHWLPICLQITYKIAVITYKTRSISTPAYLSPSFVNTNQHTHYSHPTRFYCSHCGWPLCCRLKSSVSALLQSGTHWHITLVLLISLALLGVTLKTEIFDIGLQATANVNYSA